MARNRFDVTPTDRQRGWLSRLVRAADRRWRHWKALRRARPQSLERITSRAPRRLLVVCYGNIYRSPFVAARLRSRLSSRPEFEVRSAGFHMTEHRSSPEAFVALAHRHGVDLASHRSRRIVAGDLHWADAVVIMDRFNWDMLQDMPDVSETKVVWLGAFRTEGPLEIRDPYKMPVEQVEKVVREMCESSDRFAERLVGSAVR